MATPYFQLRFDDVPSTQDVARDSVVDLPLLVIAAAQTRGRGRSGSGWLNADRAVAASLAFHHDPGDARPLSLMAGLAALRSTRGNTLKWPNDVLRGDLKVGGILVERTEDTTVIGLGLNLWWEEAPPGIGAVFQSDPGGDAHLEMGATWGAEMAELIDGAGWPIDEYRGSCVTLGREIMWDPAGSGRATDVGGDGALIVDTRSGEERIHAGAIRHVRG